MSGALRIVLVVVGVAAVVYGMSGLSALLPAGFSAVEQLLCIPLGVLSVRDRGLAAWLSPGRLGVGAPRLLPRASGRLAGPGAP